LNDVGPYVGEKLGKCPDRVQIGQRVHEPVAPEAFERDAGLGERTRIGGCRRGHPKAAVAQREQEGNAKSVIVAADAQQVRFHATLLQKNKAASD
jgi:hypothetical protein